MYALCRSDRSSQCFEMTKFRACKSFCFLTVPSRLDSPTYSRSLSYAHACRLWWRSLYRYIDPYTYICVCVCLRRPVIGQPTAVRNASAVSGTSTAFNWSEENETRRSGQKCPAVQGIATTLIAVDPSADANVSLYCYSRHYHGRKTYSG